MTDRYFIVSSWDWKPELQPDWKRLSFILKKFEIYHQGNIENLKLEILKNVKISKTKHTGSNISDYMKFIVDNYPYFPEELGLLKANLIERHIPENVFKNLLNNSGGFIPFYYEKHTELAKKNIFNKLIFQQISPGICLEISNNWYTKNTEPGRYYKKVENLLYKITGKNFLPNYIPMVPGANMLVKANKILRWDKGFFEHLLEISSYQDPPNPMPVEAWHIERLMLYIFYFEKFYE